MVNIEGSPWFVAIDVCKALGMEVDRRGAHSYLYNVDASEKQIVTRQSTPALFGGVRGGGQATIVSESGLYKLILRSDMETAKPFQDWVTKVVLPVIRKDGGYVAGEEISTIRKGTHHGCVALFEGTASTVSVISESGLYKRVLRSNLPDAKGFRDWVTRVVLPVIRQDGGHGGVGFPIFVQ